MQRSSTIEYKIWDDWSTKEVFRMDNLKRQKQNVEWAVQTDKRTNHETQPARTEYMAFPELHISVDSFAYPAPM